MPRDLPLTVKENIDSFRAAYPGYEHRLFNRAACREIIAKDFGQDVLACFDKLKPFTYQSDLARMCILHSHGGVYADVSTYFFTQWPPANSSADLRSLHRLAIFRDFCGVAPWQVATTVFFAPPRHKAIEKAIDLICINVKNEFYGCSSLSPTGPDPFGKAIALSCDPEDLVSGDSMFFLPGFYPGSKPVVTEPSHCFVYADKLYAVKRKRRDGLSELGISGSNRYNDMWLARDIYRS